MDILKRPMFFAAIICCLSAALSFFEKSITFVILTMAIATFLVVSIKKYKYITVLFSIALFCVSLAFQFEKIEQINIHDGEKISGAFMVVDEPTNHGTLNSITLKEVNCDTIPDNTKLLVFDYDKSKFKMGEIVNVVLRLSSIDKNDKYRLSDYGSGIYATASIVEIEKSGRYNNFYKIAGNIRSYAKETTSSHFKGDTAGLLVALTTGDKTLLSDDFSANVKTTGISHVIVVSGMHLSIIMAAVFLCFDRLLYNKYFRSLLSIAVVILISAVCGFTMSIIRAGVMFIIAGLAPVFNRDNDSLSSLLTAVTVVLISSPFAVANISFQLSVLSTLAIIWVVPFYYKVIITRFNISSKILKAVLSAFLCSVFAILFTLPITIRAFGYVSIVAPITNLIISYSVMIALVFNILTLVLWVVPIIKIISYPLFWIAGLCSRFIVFIVNSIAEFPITVAVLPKVAFWWSILASAVVVGYMYFMNSKRKEVI